MRLGEANSGLLLERTLEVLVDRLLARPQRRGRTLRAITISARLVGAGRGVRRWCSARRCPIRGGSASRSPSACSCYRLRLWRCSWRSRSSDPPDGDQGSLLDGERAARLTRLQDAIGQVRALAGPNAALRALVVDPRSRVPERKALFAPWQR